MYFRIYQVNKDIKMERTLHDDEFSSLVQTYLY